ncbi:MAG: hypothetical protein HYU63_00070 [Armatimonadetes bacterium]|nr:hypothetical protein [Armatimonadota bacterium]
MNDNLLYKDFVGSIHFSSLDKVFYSKIEGIDDLIIFEGKTVDELIQAFHKAVEDYIKLCEAARKKFSPSYKTYK